MNIGQALLGTALSAHNERPYLHRFSVSRLAGYGLPVVLN